MKNLKPSKMTYENLSDEIKKDLNKHYFSPTVQPLAGDQEVMITMRIPSADKALYTEIAKSESFSGLSDFIRHMLLIKKIPIFTKLYSDYNATMYESSFYQYDDYVKFEEMNLEAMEKVHSEWSENLKELKTHITELKAVLSKTKIKKKVFDSKGKEVKQKR